MSDSALAVHTTVAELCSVFAKAEHDVRAAASMLLAASKELDRAFLGGSSAGHSVASFALRNYGHDHHVENIEPIIHEMRRGAWQSIVERLELRRMMSIGRWERLERQLREDKWPELTEDNVRPFIAQFSTQLPAMLEEAIDEVFNWLRPRRDDHKYKTNSQFHLGPKVVIPHAVEANWGTGRLEIRYDQHQRFVALENVFNALDGKGQIARAHYSELANALKESRTNAGETPLFSFRAHKNRNIHLAFKRLDLVAQINKRAGERGLKPSTARAA